MKYADFVHSWISVLKLKSHLVLDMLINRMTVPAFIIGLMIGVWGSDIYSNLMHIKCDTGSNWEAFRVTKNGEEFCFMKEQKFPYRVRGGRY
jgi:hypothetical protein